MALSETQKRAMFAARKAKKGQTLDLRNTRKMMSSMDKGPKKKSKRKPSEDGCTPLRRATKSPRARRPGGNTTRPTRVRFPSA